MLSLPAGRARAAAVAVALAAAATVVALAVRQAWVCDDALITFRYVENWVAGRGLVFNPGERIEGFSNPLFVLVLAPFARAGVDLFTTSVALGVAASAIEALLLVRLTLRATRSVALAAAAAALFATDRVVAVWSSGGLETSLHALLVTAAFSGCVEELITPNALRASSLLLLVAVSRPEGAIFFALYLAQLALTARPAVPRIARAVNLFVPAAALLLLARWAYYGDLVANPFHAKLGGVPALGFGIGYARAFLVRVGLVGRFVLAWLPLVVAAAVAWRRGAGARAEPSSAPSSSPSISPPASAPPLRSALVLALAWVGAQLVATIAMGGDYMCDFRLLRPVMAIFAFAVAAALGLVARAPFRRAAAVAGTAFAVLFAAHLFRQHIAAPVFWDAPPSREHKQILTVTRARSDHFRGALLRVAEPGDSLLVDWAGFMSYGHTLRSVDCTGLVSRDLDRDFYLRKPWSDDGRARERLPGHARWPSVPFMQRERFTFIFPKLNRLPPEQPEITTRMPERIQGYPFLHVAVELDGGEWLRFFTTLTPDELAARARRRHVRLCWRPPFGALHCAD